MPICKRWVRYRKGVFLTIWAKYYQVKFSRKIKFDFKEYRRGGNTK